MTYQQRIIGDLCHQDRIMVVADSAAARALPFLGLEHIESVTGRILVQAMPDEDHEFTSTAFLFDARHVLYCKLRPYLNKVALPDFAGRCTTELIPLLPHKHVSRDYLAWLLRRPQTVQAAMQGHTGARMPRANMRNVFEQIVLVPDSIEEQQAIVREMARRMDLISKAKAACQEQLELFDAYANRVLSEFPTLKLQSKEE